jgi:hypothetical protein
MNVSHYEDVYGESLATNFAAELSAELATGLEPDGTLFTDVYKHQLITAIDHTISHRGRFYEYLDKEQDSIARGHEGLTALLNQLDGPRIPAWYSAEFEDRLSELAQRRQGTLRERAQPKHLDGIDLCTYLYTKPVWTHAVLAAVERLREAVAYDT